MSPTDASSSCEEYDIDKDSWSSLPDFPLKICSNGLITTNNYLFSIGGIVKTDSQLSLIANIFRLELGSIDQWSSWEELNVTLSQPLCDIGTSQIKKDQILVFGGWNFSSVSKVYKL